MPSRAPAKFVSAPAGKTTNWSSKSWTMVPVFPRMSSRTCSSLFSPPNRSALARAWALSSATASSATAMAAKLNLNPARAKPALKSGCPSTASKLPILETEPGTEHLPKLRRVFCLERMIPGDAETGSAGVDGRTMCFPVQPRPFAAFSWISCHQQIVAALNPSAAAQLRADQFACATSRDACQDKRLVSGGKIARSDDRTAIAQTTDLLRINVYET